MMAPTVDVDRGTRATQLLRLGWIAPVVLIGFIVVAAAVTSGYSHIENTVSQLAAQGQPYPVIMGIGFVVFGGMMAAFGLGVGLSIHRSTSRLNTGLSAVGLIVYGTAVAASGFVQDYPLHGPEAGNFEGFLHSLFAQVAVAGLFVGIIGILRWSVDVGEIRLARYTAATAIGVAAFGLVFLAADESLQGLVQRGLYVLTLAWLAILARSLLRQERR